MKMVLQFPPYLRFTLIFCMMILFGSSCSFMGGTPVPISTAEKSPTPAIQINTNKLQPTAITEFFISMNGSDDSPGTSAAPWRSIQKAADTMRGGSSVTVLEGNYPEFVTVELSNQRFTTRGKVTMMGFLVNGNENQISGFIVTNPNSNFGIRVTGNNNLIEKNDISNTSQDGIWFFGSGNIFSSNYIHDIVDRSRITKDPHVDCFQTWGPAENIVFEKNICDHNNTFGSNQITQISNVNQPVKDIIFRNNIFIMHDPGYSPMTFYHMDGNPEITNIVVVNNTFVHVNGIGTAGIWFRNISNSFAVNNLFIDYGDQSSSYILFEGSTNIQINNNVIYKTDKVVPKDGMLSNDIWLPDPGLVDEKNLNFRLSPVSAMIDKGFDASPWVTDDFDGTPRPKGEGFDIGAFEFAP